MNKKGLNRLFLLVIGAGLAPKILIARGESLDTLVVVDDSVYLAALDEKLAEIFASLLSQYESNFNEFTTTISTEATAVGVFSATKATDYKNYVTDEIDRFKENCKIAGDAALLEYYNFLSDQGRASTGSKDTVAQKIISSIETTNEYFLNKITLMMAQLFNNVSVADITTDLIGTISAYNQQVITNFQSNQKVASAMYSKTGWESFVNSLEKFMPTLGVQLVQDLSAELVKQISEYAKKGAKLIEDSMKPKTESKDGEKKAADGASTDADKKDSTTAAAAASTTTDTAAKAATTTTAGAAATTTTTTSTDSAAKAA